MTQCEVIANNVLNTGFAYEKGFIKYFNDIGNTFNSGILNFRLKVINEDKEKYGIPADSEIVAEGTYGHRKVILKKIFTSINPEVKPVEFISRNTKWNTTTMIKDMDKKYLYNTIKLLNSYGKERTKYGINGFKTDVYGFKIEEWLNVMTKEFNSR